MRLAPYTTMRITLFGDRVLILSMALIMEAGSLLTLEEVMELVFGSLLQKILISLRKTVFLNWETIEKSDSGKTLGVEDNLFVRLSLTYIA